MKPNNQPPEPSTAYGWCSWHRGTAAGIRLVTAIEQGSGPGSGANLFACAPCRARFNLTPLADRP